MLDQRGAWEPSGVTLAKPMAPHTRISALASRMLGQTRDIQGLAPGPSGVQPLNYKLLR